MKKLIFLVFIGLTILSCQNEDTLPLTKSDIHNYLLKRNPKYIFSTNNKLAKNTTTEKKLPEPIYFNNLKELDEFLNRIDAASSASKDNLTHAPPPDGGGSNGGRFVDSRLIGMGTYINIAFYNENCVPSQLTSYLSGFTLGASYNQLGSQLTHENGCIHYRVDGILNYNIIIEGIGTIFSDNVTYSGRYICSL